MSETHISDATIAEVERLDGLATKDWEFWSASVMSKGKLVFECPRQDHTVLGGCEACCNADFAVLSRTALPDAIREIERLREENKRLRKALESIE